MTTFAHGEVPIDREAPGSYPLPGQGGVGAAYGLGRVAPAKVVRGDALLCHSPAERVGGEVARCQQPVHVAS